MPKQTLKIQGFHGGINSSADPRDIKPIESPVLVDVNIDSVGKLTTLGGVSITDENPDNTLTILANKGLFVMGSDRQLDGGLGDESIVFVYDNSGSNIDAKDSEGWKTGVIDFGATVSPVYYAADGVLRVADADFSSATPETNQWFGYIEDERFSGLNASSGSVGWKSVDQNVATPSLGKCLISTPSNIWPELEGGNGGENSLESEYIDSADFTFLTKLLEGGAVNLRVGLQYNTLLQNTSGQFHENQDPDALYTWENSNENPYSLIAGINLKTNGEPLGNTTAINNRTGEGANLIDFNVNDETYLVFGLYITQTELDTFTESGKITVTLRTNMEDGLIHNYVYWKFLPDQIEADCWNILVLTNSNYDYVGRDFQGWTNTWVRWSMIFWQGTAYDNPETYDTRILHCVVSGPVLIENAEPDGFDPGLYTFHYTNIYDDSKQESLPFKFKDTESVNPGSDVNNIDDLQVDFNKVNIVGGSVLFNFDSYVTPWSDKQSITLIDVSDHQIDLAAPHGFKAGQIVMFSDLRDGGVTGISNGTNYYVSSQSLDANSFRVSSSLALAVAGTSISFGGSDDSGANFQYYKMNPRVTGSRLYWKHEENDNYFLIGELDYINNGFKWIPEQDTVVEDLVNTDSTSGFLLNKTAIVKELLPSSSNTIDSFKTTNGFSSETKSINASYKTAVVHGRRAYIGNVIQNSKTYPDRILKSQVNKFDTFPDELGVVDVAIRDGENIVKLEAFADRILEFKENSLYVINVSENVDFLEDTFRNKGCAFDYHVTKTDYGIAWFNIHGVYFYDGKSVSNLLEKDGMRLISESDWDAFITDGEDGSADDATMENAHIAYIPKKRQLLIKNENTDVFIYDFVLRAWMKGSSKITMDTFTDNTQAGAISSGTTITMDGANANIQVGMTVTGGTIPGNTTVTTVADSAANPQVFVISSAISSSLSGGTELTFAINMTNFALDSDHNLFYITDTDSDKALWSPSSTTSTGFVYQTPDIDFGEPGVRKKIYKAYVTYKTGGTTNVQVKYDTNGHTDFDLVFATNTDANFSSNELVYDSGNANKWIQAELKPNTSSQSNNIYSFALKFTTDGTVPATFEINDITIVYRMKNIK